MAELPVLDLTGQQVDTIALSDDVFAAPVNVPLMHQAVRRILADRRLGTHKAKTRSEVSGGGVKPWRQKGTGRARQGSRTSPLWKGGGVAFPPTPRSYVLRMPKKMRRAATRSALTARLADGAIVIIESLQLPEAKTRAMVTALSSVNAVGKVLVIDERFGEETRRSAQNIPGLAMKPASTVNIVDILDHDVLLFSVPGIRQLERLLSNASV
jgi:large subunit ribosomal protein L4